MKRTLISAVTLTIVGLLACTGVSQPEDGCARRLRRQQETATRETTDAINRAVKRVPRSDKAVLKQLHRVKEAFLKPPKENRKIEKVLKALERASGMLRSEGLSGPATALKTQLARVEEAFSTACL